MKHILMFFLLSVVVFAQDRNTYTDSLEADTSRFFDMNRGISRLGVFNDPHVVFIELWGTESDTLKLQGLDEFGLESTKDSLWTTRIIYNPYVASTEDTLIWLTRAEGTKVFTKVTLWQPIVPGKIRFVRNAPKGRTNKIYFKIRTVRY